MKSIFPAWQELCEFLLRVDFPLSYKKTQLNLEDQNFPGSQLLWNAVAGRDRPKCPFAAMREYRWKFLFALQSLSLHQLPHHMLGEKPLITGVFCLSKPFLWILRSWFLRDEDILPTENAHAAISQDRNKNSWIGSRETIFSIFRTSFCFIFQSNPVLFADLFLRQTQRAVWEHLFGWTKRRAPPRISLSQAGIAFVFLHSFGSV